MIGLGGLFIGGMIIIHGRDKIISQLQNHILGQRQGSLCYEHVGKLRYLCRIKIGGGRCHSVIVTECSNIKPVHSHRPLCYLYHVKLTAIQYYSAINLLLFALPFWRLFLVIFCQQRIYYDQIEQLCTQQLQYSVNKVAAMKPKRKTPPPIKKPARKAPVVKVLQYVDKTIATTKQKTHTTTEQIFQITETKPVVRVNKRHASDLSCLQKMEESNISPFSSPGRLSISPRYKKTCSPREEKQRKKVREKVLHVQKRPKLEMTKKNAKLKAKMSREESNQVAYETLLLRKMNEKKITELSQEQSLSIPKLPKMTLPLKNIKECYPLQRNRGQQGHITQLRRKVEDKYRRELPNLKPSELRFYCAIVLIQRLWRQRKIKNFISEFITPRGHQQQNMHRLGNCSKLDITATTQEQTEELIRKYHHQSPEKKDNAEKEAPSTEMLTTDKKLNLKQLQVSCELSKEQGEKMVRFVDCLRDISFSRPKRGVKVQRVNVFSLRESLSEKCIMQGFYERIFDACPVKRNNLDMFSLKKEGKHLERSIELINTMRSPLKTEVIEVEERFETELHTEETPPLEKKKQTVEKEVGTEESGALNGQVREINTLKNLQAVSEDIVYVILNEFAEEFFRFTSQTVLKKKKKSRLPGLRVTADSIREYLTGLSGYMMQTYECEVTRRYSLINPLSFLKIHHEYDDQECSAEQQEMNMPIVPNTLFYEYELIYESEKFTIEEENKKYSNFLEGLIKIHNLLLANCLSEILEKDRIDRVVLPWDSRCGPRRRASSRVVRSALEGELNSIIGGICGAAFLRIGQFHKRLDDPHEQLKMLRSINDQYKSEGNEWSPQYERLQIRMELSKSIECALWDELFAEMVIFF